MSDDNYAAWRKNQAPNPDHLFMRELKDRIERDQLRRLLSDHVVDWGDCTPDPDLNPRCVCSHARAKRVLAGESEW